MKNLNVYVVDNERNIRRSFELILNSTNHKVRTFESGESLLKNITEQPPDVVFLDVLLPGMNGIEVLKELKDVCPDTDVVMISGHANLSMAVEATRAGAYDFLEKPLKKEKILLILQHLSEHRTLLSRFSDLQSSVKEEYRLIGDSPNIQKVLQGIHKIAPTDSKVLITGESGVGKELVAYAIHQASLRKKGPFVKMNCAAIPENLTESELFGNEKGAFTGASDKRDGKFFHAHEGTLFLDEIGDMSIRVQTKVLRVLQDGEFQRVGGKDTIKVDVRIIAATNKKLGQLVDEGNFREDLYYRLNVLPIEVPPLRERQEDIPLLTEFFIQRFCQKNNRRVPQIETDVYSILKKYHWPGNIRELQNLVERLIILAEGNVITLKDLPDYLFKPPSALNEISPGSKTLNEVRKEAEREYIKQCLQITEGNISQTARLLGMERTNLHKKIKALGIK